jgi:hypothetical protein
MRTNQLSYTPRKKLIGHPMADQLSFLPNPYSKTTGSVVKGAKFDRN